MASLTVSLPRSLQVPRPDPHRIAGAVRAAGQQVRAAFRTGYPRECKRHEFLEDSLLSREMYRL